MHDVQYDAGSEAWGEKPWDWGLCWLEWQSRLHHLPNAHIGQVIDLLVPQFPHLQKAELSIRFREFHIARGRLGM